MDDSGYDAPWYADGLQFGCTRCGACCTGDPGTVRISEDEIEALASLLDLDRDAFRALYTRALRRGEVSLVEKRNHDCIFWDRSMGCRVYSARPRQCRTWPFWRAVVHSPETWAEEARHCPGMNRGTRFDSDTIRAIAARDGTTQDV